MSKQVLEDVCIGCGACDFSCPTGALTKTDSFLGLFAIDPYTCDDCGRCIDKCPVGAIVADPTWPECQARGCPLTSNRLSGLPMRLLAGALPRLRLDPLAVARRVVGAARAAASG